jgi:hypothetical protein
MSAVGGKADMTPASPNVPNDPERTSAVHCGKGFEASFSPYQSAHLNRYDAVS